MTRNGVILGAAAAILSVGSVAVVLAPSPHPTDYVSPHLTKTPLHQIDPHSSRPCSD